MSVNVVQGKLDTATPVLCHATVPSGPSPRAAIVVHVTPAMESPPMGSYVYAVPRGNEVLTTRLFHEEGTVEGAERLARMLVKQLGHPAFVTSSVANADSVFMLTPATRFVREALHS